MKKIIKLLEFIKQNKTFLLLAAIALILFNHYIVLIGLIIFFWFLGMISFKVTGMIPHVSVETISASSILLGYIWGWKWGLGFGLIFGLYGYIQISRIKLKSIINVLLMGLGGVLSAIFASLNYSFTIAYMFTFIIRIIMNNIIFLASLLARNPAEIILLCLNQNFNKAFFCFVLYNCLRNTFF